MYLCVNNCCSIEKIKLSKHEVHQERKERGCLNRERAHGCEKLETCGLPQISLIRCRTETCGMCNFKDPIGVILANW